MSEDENINAEESAASATVNDADLADFDSPPAAKDEAVETVAQATAEAGGDDKAPAKEAETEHKPVMIPKARFDEVNGELKELKARMEAFEAQQRQAAAPAPRDFTAERNDLKTRYDNGDIDRDEYYEAREALAIAEAEARFNSTILQREQEMARQKAQIEWQQTISAWEQANADFLANSIRRDAIASLLTKYGQDASLDNAALIAKVEAEAFDAFNWAGKTPSSAPVVNLHAARNAADARAQAAASSAPSMADVGSGDRGRKSFPGITDMSDSDFKRLPKEVREAKDLANF